MAPLRISFLIRSVYDLLPSQGRQTAEHVLSSCKIILSHGRYTWRHVESFVNMLCRLGIPEEILSDFGTQFVSECMEDLNRLLGIRNLTTTPYHPMCNGLVERFNRTLKLMLRNSLRSSQDNGTDLSLLCWSHTERFLKRQQDFLQLNCSRNGLCADQCTFCDEVLL